MTKFYSVGPDELTDEDQVALSGGQYDWVVYWYENYGYDGSGEAVGLLDGRRVLEIFDLGHCSCYGPLEDWQYGKWRVVSVREFMASREEVLCHWERLEVSRKVVELLEASVPGVPDPVS